MRRLSEADHAKVSAAIAASCAISPPFAAAQRRFAPSSCDSPRFSRSGRCIAAAWSPVPGRGEVGWDEVATGLQDVVQRRPSGAQSPRLQRLGAAPAFEDRIRLALGAQAGEKRLTEVLNEGGFTQVRRASITVFAPSVSQSDSLPTAAIRPATCVP